MFRPLEPVKKKRKSIRRQDVDQEASAVTPLMVRIKRARDDSLRNDENEPDQPDHFHSSTNSLNNTVKLVGIKAKRSSTLTDSAVSLSKKTNEAPLLSASKRSLANGDDDSAAQPMNRDDAFYTGSLQRLPQYRENPASYHASVTRVSIDII